MQTFKATHFINGEWITAGPETSAPEIIESQNPATGEVFWRAPAATDQQVEAAVAAARDAFAEWRLLTFVERESYIQKFVECLTRRETELAELIHQETGKPLWESKTELGTMKGKAAISVAAYHERTGDKHNTTGAVATRLGHRPIGVFAVLGPYNFPGHLPNGHIIPALLAGNTIVFKPSELTPAFGEQMIAAWEQAGLPPGVINLVQGGRTTGEALVGAADINGVLFTGSAKTGEVIHRSLAGQPDKMLALEMGGNNPLIVEQVADLKAAVYTIIQSAFISAGQRCTCARRLILIENENNRRLMNALLEATQKLKVGPDDDCFMGPLISAQAAESALAFESRLLSAGATSLLAMQRPEDKGAFIQPGLIDISHVKQAEDEECFGPLLQIEWVSDLESAVISANNTRYGLAAGLLSDHAAAWDYFYPRINAGIVNFNRPLTGASGSAPFGGIGASGNYRPSAYYAADYCAYPIASLLDQKVELPESLAPGVEL